MCQCKLSVLWFGDETARLLTMKILSRENTQYNVIFWLLLLLNEQPCHIMSFINRIVNYN